MADDLWAKLCAMPRPHKVVDFPRNGEDGKPLGQIAIWVLTQEEQEAASSAANQKSRKLLKDAKVEVSDRADMRDAFKDLYNNVAADEILYRAVRKPDDLKSSFFPSPDLLRQHLSVDEVGVLMNLYLSTQEELGPVVAHMSHDEVEALISRLERDGSRFPLDLLSADALRTLVVSLVPHLRSSLTGTSSPGKPPEGGSSETSPSADD